MVLGTSVRSQFSHLTQLLYRESFFELCTLFECIAQCNVGFKCVQICTKDIIQHLYDLPYLEDSKQYRSVKSVIVNFRFLLML
jgi:hypothetical protein